MIVGLIVALASLAAGSGLLHDDTNDSDLDGRTCEIARDIAADFRVTDTLEESRQRVADLYNGYGQSASTPIAAGLRRWSAGMTTGNYADAADGVNTVSSACSAEGY